MPQAARGKIGGVRLFDGLPGVEHHHAVRDGQGQLKVVRNQEHPRARVRDLPEVAQDAARGPGVQARRGFVRDDQPGRLHHGGGDQHPARHPAGELERVQFLRLRAQPIPLQDGTAFGARLG